VGAEARPRCEAPAKLIQFNAPMPNLSAALASGKPVRIVALGSSSTEGIGASSPKACYPVRLQSELRRRFPGKKIRVDNLGIGGQLATDMLPRIKNDVLPREPTVVIWQTGVNDAVRKVDIKKFRRTVSRGIESLQKHGVDVVLLDMQYFPRSEKINGFKKYVGAMREIAKEQEVPLLQRFAIMRHWVKSAIYRPQEVLAKDLFHPNDVTYGCLGRFLADAMQAKVGRSRPDGSVGHASAIN
jgi:lysophospholipase L1-like esterase